MIQLPRGLEALEASRSALAFPKKLCRDTVLGLVTSQNCTLSYLAYCTCKYKLGTDVDQGQTGAKCSLACASFLHILTAYCIVLVSNIQVSQQLKQKTKMQMNYFACTCIRNAQCTYTLIHVFGNAGVYIGLTTRAQKPNQLKVTATVIAQHARDCSNSLSTRKPVSFAHHTPLDFSSQIN